MTRLRFRPFGPFGSFAEIMVGIWLLRTFTAEDPGEPGAATITVWALGGLVIATGVVGLVVHLRRWVVRST
ncbi:hypothetical protein ASE01_08680 [Nocardioides sp. Root190]|uniref:hypothetical protein n=1 Tax=Nocardioides sp. Root190 TaxID=1736488 RepID=UPI0007017ABA|nr:hypothetical protein [Nocardioides sp. Root190]KRB76839.1 hypothetical protein ASE01_08680 [Nocardioides sp. Root190]